MLNLLRSSKVSRRVPSIESIENRQRGDINIGSLVVQLDAMSMDEGVEAGRDEVLGGKRHSNDFT